MISIISCFLLRSKSRKIPKQFFFNFKQSFFQTNEKDFGFLLEMTKLLLNIWDFIHLTIT